MAHPSRSRCMPSTALSLVALFSFAPLGAEFTPARAALNPREQSVAAQLTYMRKHPKLSMRKLPPKWDAKGKVIAQQWSRFSWSDTHSNEFILLKAQSGPFSAPMAPDGDGLKAPIGDNDHAESLVDAFAYDRLDAMVKDSLTTANVKVQPWSGDYWPLAAGEIANRYADPDFPGSYTWKENSDYLLAHLGQSADLLNLSPAEKYDLLVGDANFTLTRKALQAGAEQADPMGNVDLWMGICHGWSPASYMVARPAKKIQVLASDGTSLITFFPDDLKALSSLLWSSGSFSSKFIGSRCNVRDPVTDQQNGRVIDERCFDSNPATWHLAVVNQIGHAQRPFVMDASFDYQVWNQPITGYEFSFFNPKDMKPVATLAEATLAIADHPTDRFKKYRSPNAVALVGIAMDLKYVSESAPSQTDLDTPENDNVDTVRYMYDVELDASGRLVGGEWYSRAHPDFLWSPAKSAQALTVGDKWLAHNAPLAAWDGHAAIPVAWRKASLQSAINHQPLGKLVNALHALANSTP